MKMQRQGGTLNISASHELDLANCQAFESEALAAVRDDTQAIIIDLSETEYLDCSGLGALVALRNAAQARNHVTVRLTNVAPAVRPVFSLTKMDWLLPNP